MAFRIWTFYTQMTMHQNFMTARSNISFDGPILFKEHVDDNMM